MSSLIDLFSSKIDEKNYVGDNNFFHNREEIKELNKSQERFITNIDYSDPQNFAYFGSAEEYYKNSITYLESQYPYDASTSNKYKWINSLNDLEYYIFNSEYPRHLGYAAISSSQYIEVLSHVKNPEGTAKNVFNSGSYLTSNTVLDFDVGFTFESWIKFEDSDEKTRILDISAYVKDISYSKVTLLTVEKGLSGDNRISISDSDTSYYFETQVQNEEWNHYCIHIKSGSAKLFINGNHIESLNNLSIEATKYEYSWLPLGLMILPITEESTVDEFNNSSIFKIGGGGKSYFDETRFWNGERSPENIGRYWFTNVDGNDYLDDNNSSLMFYFKYNEGWDSEYSFLCLDSSGRKNDSEIKDYEASCKLVGSGIISSGIQNGRDNPEIIIEGTKYSQEVKDYYSDKIYSGSLHDDQNQHMLYKKFPTWILLEEENANSQHLKNITQIMCYYFDDLYNKLKEITNFKETSYVQSVDNIYPFYDKILTSMGFDVGPLFNDLNLMERVSSRTETNIFDENTQKIKNAIYKNIYNNLSSILKSKGTEKSIRMFLNSYGINDEIVKINLYGNNISFDTQNRLKKTSIKKKTLSLFGDNIVRSSGVYDRDYFTLEASIVLNNANLLYTSATSSLFGISNGESEYYITLEKSSNLKNTIAFNIFDGVNTTKYFYEINNYNIYDDSVWNMCLRKKPALNTTMGASSEYDSVIEFYCVNNNTHVPQQLSASHEYYPSSSLNYYIGSKKNSLDVTIHPANSSFLYCNFWNDYLKNETIDIHNREILNYGFNE